MTNGYRIDPFKRKTLAPEIADGVIIKKIEDIVYESPHTYQYDEDGNLKFEQIIYKDEIYIREYVYSILKNRKSVGIWRLKT